MRVHCTCPSYTYQDPATSDAGRQILCVCKHLKAALDNVCDGDDPTEEETDKKEEGVSEVPKERDLTKARTCNESAWNMDCPYELTKPLLNYCANKWSLTTA